LIAFTHDFVTMFNRLFDQTTFV